MDRKSAENVKQSKKSRSNDYVHRDMGAYANKRIIYIGQTVENSLIEGTRRAILLSTIV